MAKKKSNSPEDNLRELIRQPGIRQTTKTWIFTGDSLLKDKTRMCILWNWNWTSTLDGWIKRITDLLWKKSARVSFETNSDLVVDLVRESIFAIYGDKVLFHSSNRSINQIVCSMLKNKKK